MTSQRYDAWLAALGPCEWSELRSQPMERWLWLCFDPKDPLGLAKALPTSVPPGVTHVWGWSRERLVRARIDRYIPGGRVLGAVLHLREAPGNGAGTKVRAESIPGQTWDPLDGRVNAEPDHPLFSDRRLTRWNVVLHQEDASGALTLSTLSFLSLGY